MKRKVGTTLDQALYRRVPDVAHRQDRSTNTVIEEALARYVSSALNQPSVVEETKGPYRTPPKALREILGESLYGPD